MEAVVRGFEIFSWTVRGVGLVQDGVKTAEKNATYDREKWEKSDYQEAAFMALGIVADGATLTNDSAGIAD